jgi:Secretion system C-terminal sorting domain
MKKTLWFMALLCTNHCLSQNLNWNTVSYTTGALSTNFGSIGSPATTVSLNITGNTNRINGSFPIKYAANPSGTANDCAVNCAIRSSVTFVASGEFVAYTFTFSPAVTGLSFRIYDIDGTDASSGDQATVTAVNGSTGQNITLSTPSGPTITGSGTTTAIARGTQGNTTDDFADVSIISGVTSLTVSYANNPNNPTAGNRSFSIGNFNWSGVLPVKWVSFTGNRQSNGSVLLKWATTSETAVLKYIIERSKDGQQYTAISELPAFGNSSLNTYTAFDPAPGSGNSLYRIRQVDMDGQFSFSGIVMIKELSGYKDISIFPNPSRSLIQITVPGNVQFSSIKIFDATGRLVINAARSNGQVDIRSLKNGVYHLQAENNDGLQYKTSFIKE